MRSRLVRMLIALMLSATFSFAQQTQSSAADAPTRTDIHRLFDVMQIREQMQSSRDMMVQQMRQITREAITKRHPETTVLDFAKMDEIADNVLKSMPVDAMLEDVIPIYQKHLTKADIDAMIAFFGTPTGQKLMREQPQMAAESMQAASVRMQKSMDEAMDRIEKMTREDAATSTDAAKKPGASKPVPKKPAASSDPPNI